MSVAMDAVSAQSAKLAGSLPDDLKSIAADGVRPATDTRGAAETEHTRAHAHALEGRAPCA